MSLNMVDLYTVCNISNSHFCSRCQSARYGSRACQCDDGPTYKLFCATFSSFEIDSSRSTSEHFLATLFRSKTKSLKVFGFIASGAMAEIVNTSTPNLNRSLVLMLFRSIYQFNTVRCWENSCPDTLYVWDGDTFLIDDSKENDSISSITATKPGQYHDWQGLIIVYSNVGPSFGQKMCKDLDMADFRHSFDTLLSYACKPTSVTKQTKARGVKINCIGDRKLLNKTVFEAVEVLSTYTIFSEHDTSDIAGRIGPLIFTRRCPLNSMWAKDQENKVFEFRSPFDNTDATLLPTPALQSGSRRWDSHARTGLGLGHRWVTTLRGKHYCCVSG